MSSRGLQRVYHIDDGHASFSSRAVLGYRWYHLISRPPLHNQHNKPRGRARINTTNHETAPESTQQLKKGCTQQSATATKREEKKMAILVRNPRTNCKGRQGPKYTSYIVVEPNSYTSVAGVFFAWSGTDNPRAP